MDVQERNSTRIYALSTGPSLPEWMGERARRNLSKRDDNIRRRIELIQDFQMPCASSKMIQSRDGKYIVVAGTYSPRIRCYELEELSMKFERVLDGDVMDLCFVGASEDYGKMAILQADRTIQFHAPYGHHASIRIPSFGRQMSYEPSTCELLIASSPANRTADQGQIYRFNLEEGRFQAPLTFATKDSSNSNSKIGANCIAVSPTHALTALGCEDGLVRFWDSRTSAHSASSTSNFIDLDVKTSTAGYGFYTTHSNNTNTIVTTSSDPHEITSLAFDSATGMYMAAGTKGGNVALYDMRSSKPLHVKEHQYGLPIHTVQFHHGSSTVLSSDAKLVKIWRSKPGNNLDDNHPLHQHDNDNNDMYLDNNNHNHKQNNYNSPSSSSSSKIGSIVANIEGVGDFSHFITAGDQYDPTGQSSGVVLCAGEQPKMQSFYCPVLGPAPKWCSFLDGITEELEERDLHETNNNTNTNNQIGTTMDMMTGKNAGTIYEDYKFLTRTEIEQLNIEHLVGTPLLRGYMHGFFIDIGLYNRVRAVANPFEYEEYRKNKIRQKMADKRASLIAPKSSSNKKQNKDNSNNTKVNSDLAQRLSNTTKDKNLAKSILKDDRFGSLFTNPDFQIDQQDINFKLRNPSGVKQQKRNEEDMDSDADDYDDNDDDHDDNDKGNMDGFHRVTSDDDDDHDGWNNTDNDTDDDDDNQSYDSHGEDEDGIRGGQVRGEMYEQMKEMNKKHRKNNKQKQNKPKKNKKKSTLKMYEGDDDYYDDDLTSTNDHHHNSNHALNVGLGGNANSSQIKKKINLSKMSLKQRLALQKEEQDNNGIISTKRILGVKGEGASKEVTFIPKDVLRKRQQEADNKRKMEQQLRGTRGDDTKRNRRGIKDLRLKTPFKHQA